MHSNRWIYVISKADFLKYLANGNSEEREAAIYGLEVGAVAIQENLLATSLEEIWFEPA